MNDVLPKPFTKEGLLQMLEKHLGQLKKNSTALDHMGAPPQPTLAQVAAKNSMKSEESPATSPATVNNWHSPGNTLGVSPANSSVTADEYMMTAQQGPPGPYQLQAPQLGPQMAYGGMARAPAGPPGGPAPHRRQISDISGGPGDLGGDMKRQQMYGPPGVMAPHMAPPHGMPMGQAVPGQMNPMQRRAG